MTLTWATWARASTSASVATMSTVLITGASTGIGRATTLHLASTGWTVLAGVRKPDDGDALVADGGERVAPIVLDVTRPAQIAAAVERVEEHGGRLDALVNNAGVGYGGPLELLPIGRFARPARGQRARAGRRHPGAAAGAASRARTDRARLLDRRACGDGVHRAVCRVEARDRGDRRRAAGGVAQLARAGRADRAGLGRDADLGQGPCAEATA